VATPASLPPEPVGPPEPVDQDEYRRLSDLLAVGLAVVTTRQGPHDLAVTVDSYLDLSYDPPTMLVALYGMSRAAEAVEEAGHCCLTLLTADQQELADRFGTPGAPLQGMLNGLEVTRTADGDAILRGGLAHFALRVDQAVDAATHRLLIGPVVEMGEGRLDIGPAVRFAGEKRGLA
jgi:flavin reductase (DIM6/NTAB) family NADH-FMN oxidoreductase RutF